MATALAVVAPAAEAVDPRKKKSTDGVAGVWHAQGFGQALEEALLPIMTVEKEYSLEDLAQNVGKKIMKAAKKFANDERTNQRGSSTTAQVVISDYVDAALGGISQGLYEKQWLNEVNWLPPLLAALTYCFTGAKVFNRVAAPMVPHYLETSIAQFREEQRVERTVWDCIEQTGVKKSFTQKAFDKLTESYDVAHFKAPYGTHAAETPELGMLQDFVRGWMFEFVKSAQDVLSVGAAGEGSNRTSRDEQVLFVTVLFQNLCDSKNACLPSDLTSLIPVPPPTPWSFVAECTEAVFTEVANVKEEERETGKNGKGKGKDKWGGGGDWGGGGGWGMEWMDPWTLMQMKGAAMKGAAMKGWGKGDKSYDKGWGKGW